MEVRRRKRRGWKEERIRTGLGGVNRVQLDPLFLTFACENDYLGLQYFIIVCTYIPIRYSFSFLIIYYFSFLLDLFVYILQYLLLTKILIKFHLEIYIFFFEIYIVFYRSKHTYTWMLCFRVVGLGFKLHSTGEAPAASE